MECEKKGGNVGVGSCDVVSQRIDGIIFVPKNAEIPKNTTDVVSFLVEKFKEDNPDTRYYPVMNIQQATNSSEEAQLGSLGYGYQVKQRSGNAIYRWDIPFSVCVAKNLIAFDGWKQGIFLVTSEGKITGRNSMDKTKLVPFLPMQLDVVDAQLINIGTTDVQVVGLQINFGDKLKLVQLAEFLQADELDNDLLQGLTDIDLTVVGQATGYVDVKVQTKCGGVDLFDTYKTELADETVWKAVNKATGVSVVPTSIVAQEATKSFRITLSAATYLLSLAAVSVLEAAGISGYESNQITVTISS
jgi:hypothetical protein